MCPPNNNHMLDFKNAQVIEKAANNIYTIKGRANGMTVLLHFRKNSTPCQGTQIVQLICYFEHSGWAEAKQKALANQEFFHVHGNVATGGDVSNAALSYSNSSGGAL